MKHEEVVFDVKMAWTCSSSIGVWATS